MATAPDEFLTTPGFCFPVPPMQTGTERHISKSNLRGENIHSLDATRSIKPTADKQKNQKALHWGL